MDGEHRRTGRGADWDWMETGGERMGMEGGSGEELERHGRWMGNGGVCDVNVYVYVYVCVSV